MRGGGSDETGYATLRDVVGRLTDDRGGVRARRGAEREIAAGAGGGAATTATADDGAGADVVTDDGAVAVRRARGAAAADGAMRVAETHGTSSVGVPGFRITVEVAFKRSG